MFGVQPVLTPNFVRASASAILSVVYDIPPLQSTSNPFVEQIDSFGHVMNRATSPLSVFLESLPIMKYIPASTALWNRYAEEARKTYSKLFGSMFCEVENRIMVRFRHFISAVASPHCSSAGCRVRETSVQVSLGLSSANGTAYS